MLKPNTTAIQLNNRGPQSSRHSAASWQQKTLRSRNKPILVGGLNHLYIYISIYGWWFQPPWKIWVGMISPNIWTNKKYVLFKQMLNSSAATFFGHAVSKPCLACLSCFYSLVACLSMAKSSFRHRNRFLFLQTLQTSSECLSEHFHMIFIWFHMFPSFQAVENPGRHLFLGHFFSGAWSP